MQLFFSVFNEDGVVALFDKGELVVERSLNVTGREADSLLVVISEMLSECGKEIFDVGKIACVVGPGFFTSLRVAAMVANTLAFTLQIPIVAIDSFEYFSLRHGGIWPVYIDAGRNEYFESKNGVISEVAIVPKEGIDFAPGERIGLGDFVPAFFDREGEKQIAPLYIKDAHITKSKK